MLFDTHDKYGRVKDSHPRIGLLILILMFLFAVYKNYDAASARKESLRTQVEKNASNMLFAELTEENLEYYLSQPYCGYQIESKKINLKNINREAKGAEVFSKEYSAGKDDIKITLCYSVEEINSKAQKHLLILIILFISSFILTRRHFEYEKAKLYEAEKIRNSEQG